MIQPGLERISLLLKDVQFPWKAIHVAGTNGKGSICHHAAALLKRRTIRVGQFTSPHLVDRYVPTTCTSSSTQAAHNSRWDCISINEKPVEEEAFRKTEQHFTKLNVEENINASPFEILTATAFTIFNRAKIDVGVIEVGMGGKLDATNILNNQAISVISKIAKDHEGFLGNTLEEIAKHKAGILRPNVPYIVNPMNEWNVQDVIDDYAKEIGAGPRLSGDTTVLRENLYSHKDWRRFANDLQPFQRDNVVLAVVAVKATLASMKTDMKYSLIADELNKKRIAKPGRFEWMRCQPIFGSPGSVGKVVLVDGAHNPDAASALSEFMAVKRRRPRGDRKSVWPPTGGWPVTWVLAMTEGKDAAQYLRTILRPGDNVVTTSFGPVDGMPWVKPMDPKALLEIAQSVQHGITGLAMPVPSALRALCAAKYLAHTHDPIVLTGSLYLVGDLHREMNEQRRNRHDHWEQRTSQEERNMFRRMHREESNRVRRLFSSLSTDAPPEDNAAAGAAEAVAAQKEKLKAQIDALDEEMELLTVQEQELLGWSRSSLEELDQENAPEESTQEHATEEPLQEEATPNIWSMTHRPHKKGRERHMAHWEQVMQQAQLEVASRPAERERSHSPRARMRMKRTMNEEISIVRPAFLQRRRGDVDN